MATSGVRRSSSTNPPPTTEKTDTETTKTKKKTKKKSFIVDTDAGNFSDDFWALALQLSDPSIDIQLVVTSGYETKLKTKVVAKFLQHCGRDSIPIARGVHTPECPYLFPDEDGLLQQRADFAEGCVTNPVLRRWATGYDLACYGGTIFGIDGEESESSDDEDRNDCRHGLDRVESLINATPDLTYVLQGSSENVGALLDSDPDLFRRNGVRIVCMGGTLEKEHEYNFGLDPINTRRMLGCTDDVTVVPVEPSFHAMLHGVEQRFDESENPDDPTAHNSYSVYLNGDSRICLAMAQLQLALANYGTHKEVADGRTDIMFDSVAAFVASGRRRELYVVKEMVAATITDTGRIVPAESDDEGEEEGDGDGAGAVLSFKVMTDWVSAEAANEFKYLVAETIAAGVLLE